MDVIVLSAFNLILHVLAAGTLVVVAILLIGAWLSRD